MPVRYAPPAPIAAFGYAAGRQPLPLAGSRGDRGAYGYGGAYGGPIPYDTGIQDAVNARGAMDFAVGREFGDFAQQNAAAQNAAQMQRDRFQLQAELQQTELTQAENMRLFRMKNAIGEIANDPTWSAEDKAAVIAELKTGIDPLQKREARQRIAANTQMMNQHAEQYRLNAALQQEELDAARGGFSKREYFAADPTALAEISADIRSELGSFGNAVPEAWVQKMAKEEAIRQGLGVHGHIDPKKGFEAFDKTAGRGKEGSQRGMITPDDLAKFYQEATAQVDRQAGEKIKSISGEESFRFPNLSDLKTREGRVAEIVAARIEAASKLGFDNPAAQQGKPRSRSGYDPSKAAFRRNKGVATVATPQGDQQQPGGDSAANNFAGRVDNQVNEITVSPALSVEDKNRATADLGRLKEIIAEHKSAKNLPDDLRREVEAIEVRLDDARRKMKAGPVDTGRPVSPSDLKDIFKQTGFRP